MKPKFMIKYGKEEHLQQLVDGKIRFAPSQTYVRLEEAQHNKGQGDLLEGKMKIKMQSARLHSIETNELIRELPAGTMVVSLQNVNNMPVFCISQYDERQISDYTDELHYTITLTDEKIGCIQNDFPEASHALIILEPDKFINEVRNIDGHRFISDSIRYYDYDINPLQMYMFLATGEETVQTNTVMSMTYDNRYRNLLCKDISFSQQDEYRFIEINELITDPVFYSFLFTSRYLIVPIEQLKKPLIIGD